MTKEEKEALEMLALGVGFFLLVFILIFACGKLG